MNIETQRKNIVHRILDVENTNLLSNIEKLLDEEVFTYKANGAPLTKNEYQEHISKILHASEDTENGYLTEDAKAKIKKK
jgi:hypothetical protein